MKLSIFNQIQRAHNGGSPLDNESAFKLGITHGTPLVTLPTRQFVALLKTVRQLCTDDPSLVERVNALLDKHDSFVIPVDPSELTAD